MALALVPGTDTTPYSRMELEGIIKELDGRIYDNTLSTYMQPPFTWNPMDSFSLLLLADLIETIEHLQNPQEINQGHHGDYGDRIIRSAGPKNWSDYTTFYNDVTAWSVYASNYLDNAVIVLQAGRLRRIEREQHRQRNWPRRARFTDARLAQTTQERRIEPTQRRVHFGTHYNRYYAPPTTPMHTQPHFQR